MPAPNSLSTKDPSFISSQKYGSSGNSILFWSFSRSYSHCLLLISQFCCSAAESERWRHHVFEVSQAD